MCATARGNFCEPPCGPYRTFSSQRTHIWLGQPFSVCKRVLERMDAFIAEADKATGHMPAYGKVAGVAVVGNEDGAHHVCADFRRW